MAHRGPRPRRSACTATTTRSTLPWPGARLSWSSTRSTCPTSTSTITAEVSARPCRSGSGDTSTPKPTPTPHHLGPRPASTTCVWSPTGTPAPSASGCSTRTCPTRPNRGAHPALQRQAGRPPTTTGCPTTPTCSPWQVQPAPAPNTTTPQRPGPDPALEAELDSFAALLDPDPAATGHT